MTALGLSASEFDQDFAEDRAKPSLLSRVRNRAASLASVVSDVRYILFKTDDMVVALNQFSDKARGALTLTRNKDKAGAALDSVAVESKPKLSLRERAAQVGRNLVAAVPAAAAAVRKDWKNLLTTASVVGGTRAALKLGLGMAGAPVLASLAVVSTTCGTISGILKTHKEYRATRDMTGFDGSRLNADLSFRDFLMQDANRGKLTKNIASSIAVSSIGALIGFEVSKEAGSLFGFASKLKSGAEHLFATPAMAQEAVAAKTDAALSAAATPSPASISTEHLDAYGRSRFAAAQNGSAQAMKDVAIAEWYGQHGFNVNRADSLSWLRRAADLGNRQAKRDLPFLSRLYKPDVASVPSVAAAPAAVVSTPNVASAVVADSVPPAATSVPSSLPPVAPNASFDEAFAPLRGAATGSPPVAAAAPLAAPALVPDAPAAKPSVAGRLLGCFGIKGFDVTGGAGTSMTTSCDAQTMARIVDVPEDTTLTASDSTKFVYGNTEMDIPARNGEKLSDFWQRVFAYIPSAQQQLAPVDQAISRGTPLADALQAGQSARVLETGQQVVGTGRAVAGTSVARVAEGGAAISNTTPVARTSFGDAAVAATGGSTPVAAVATELPPVIEVDKVALAELPLTTLAMK